VEGGTEAESSTLAAQLLQRITRATLTGLVLVRICTSSGEFWTRGYPLEEIFPRLLGIPDQGCGVKADPASDAPLGNTTIRLVFAQASASSGPERAGLDSDSNDESGRPSTYTHTVKHTHTHAHTHASLTHSKQSSNATGVRQRGSEARHSGHRASTRSLDRVPSRWQVQRKGVEGSAG